MLSVWVPAVIKGDKHVYTHADVINSLSWPVFFPRTYPLPRPDFLQNRRSALAFHFDVAW